MAQMPTATKPGHQRSLIQPAATLARWRLHDTWRLVVLVGLGVTAAVTLVCSAPLLAQLGADTGLRSALTASSGTDTLVVSAPTRQPVSSLAGTMGPVVERLARQDIGPYLETDSTFSLAIGGLNLPGGGNTGGGTADGASSLRLSGYPIELVASHVILEAGRLPRPGSDGVEIAVTRETANSLDLNVGRSVETRSLPGLPLRVVGIFTKASGDDPFWHGEEFDPEVEGSTTFYAALAENAGLFAAFESQAHPAAGAPAVGAPLISTFLLWYYRLRGSALGVGDLEPLLSGIQRLQGDVFNAFDTIAQIQGADVLGPSLDVLQRYADRLAELRGAVTILLAQILALVLLFGGTMTDLVVERQIGTIGLLRSRGASRGDVFAALALQGLGIGLAALAIGPLLAIMTVLVLARGLSLSPGTFADTLSVSTLLAAALRIGPFALLAAGGATVVLFVGLARALRYDVVTTRREQSRGDSQPFWQRFGIDIAAGLVGLTGYAAYLLIGGGQDANTRRALAPLALGAPFFCLFAAVLLSLRLIPPLLRAGARSAMGWRRAEVTLALVQMARAPLATLRTLLVLTPAVAFLVFALSFATSQTQRLGDVAAFEAGADFSGGVMTTPAISGGAGGKSPPPTDVAAPYLSITGMIAASAGYRTTYPASATAAGIPVQLMAVEPASFTRAINWPEQDGARSLAALPATLAADSAVSGDLPAVVDAALWQTLRLHTGERFTLARSGGSAGYVTMIAAMEVPYLPSFYDDPADPQLGGIIVDYDRFAAAYAGDGEGTAPASNYIWLRTDDDPATLARVRAALAVGELRLSPLNDRRARMDSLRKDPLQITLSGVLLIGAVTAVALALIGALLLSWANIRGRRTQDAVLRALGATPGQLKRIALWTQGITFSIASILGLVMGALLVTAIVPLLVYVDIAAPVGGSASPIAAAFDPSTVARHSVPAVEVTLPLPLLAGVLGALGVVCVVAIGVMAHAGSQGAITESLRLGEE